MKDNFSTQANQYAQFRPTYPKALYKFIAANVNDKSLALDVATGNGQVAVALASIFEQVYATDISAQQLAHAQQRDNLIYKVEQAEKTDFPDQMFNLITVAQAIHWFNFDAFFQEVKRILKPDGLFVAIGYGLLKINDPLNAIIYRLYKTILGNYWDEERKHVDEGYQTIPFPLHEIESPELEVLTEWNFDQLIGYLETWSALQHYLKANNSNPVNLIIVALKQAWGSEEMKEIHFPLIIKAGRIIS